jgi:AMP-binding enzyme C-terminal domain
MPTSTVCRHRLARLCESDIVVAIVVRGPGAFVRARLFEHCERMLERLHVPDYVQVVSELPKTASEKVQTRFLAAALDPTMPGVHVRGAASPAAHRRRRRLFSRLRVVGPSRSVAQAFRSRVQPGFVKLMLGVPEDQPRLGHRVDLLTLNIQVLTQAKHACFDFNDLVGGGRMVYSRHGAYLLARYVANVHAQSNLPHWPLFVVQHAVTSTEAA